MPGGAAHRAPRIAHQSPTWLAVKAVPGLLPPPDRFSGSCCTLGVTSRPARLSSSRPKWRRLNSSHSARLLAPRRWP